MQKNQELQDIITLIENRQLGRALRGVENYLLTRQLQADADRVAVVRQDYDYLLQYWRQGYADPQRNELYDKLLRQLYVLTTNLVLKDWLRGSPYLKNLYTRTRQTGRNWTVSAIRQQLENYVSEQAMLSLEPENKRQVRREELERQHAMLMNDLFDYIVTTRLWPDTLSEAFEEMLLSPTIDSLDQQLIVSAITLSAMQAFDFNKFSVLANVCRQTTDDALRQRALVGWVLALDGNKNAIYPDLHQLVADLCADEQIRQALTELQMQLIYCMEAENDGKTIMSEIMPELMKGNNMRVTRHGLEEIDEDALEDILHPEAAEQNMERMEQSMHRMANMQKQGADIYFGGFSQMKRFPFFNQLSSWFVPFYSHHPAVSAVWQRTRGRRFLETVTAIGTFCDSDKYSFVLAFEQLLDRIPQSVLSMIEQGDATPIPIGGDIDLEEQRQPAFRRRMYLQNLYRFFRLYAVRSEFADPFSDVGRYLFFANPVFRGTALQQRSMEVAAFLLKRKRREELRMVLDGCDDSCHNYQYYMLRARIEKPAAQRTSYKEALRLQPESEQALAGYARACFNLQIYEEAVGAYERLAKLQERMSYQLSLAACLANCGRTSEAEPILFKLNYLHPDNKNVLRILAWTLMAGGKYEQAEKCYGQLEGEDVTRGDAVYHAICLWLMGRIADAIDRFNVLTEPLETIIDSERQFLLQHGVGPVDIQLMLDSVDSH